MKLLDIQEGRVVYSPLALTIPEFKAIWDRDDNILKERATQELGYVTFCAHWQSPYRVSAEGIELKTRVARELLKLKAVPLDKVLDDAIRKFEEMQYTDTLVYLERSKRTANNLTKYAQLASERLDDPEYFDVYDPMKITNILVKVPSIIKTIDESIELAKKQISTNRQTLKGGRKKGNREDPKK